MAKKINHPMDGKKIRFREISVSENGVGVMVENARVCHANIAKPNTKYKASGEYGVTVMIPKSDFQALLPQVQKHLLKMLKQNKKLPTEAERKFVLKQALAYDKDAGLFKNGDALGDESGKPKCPVKGMVLFAAKSNGELLPSGGVKPKFDIKLVLADKSVVEEGDASRHFYSGVWCDVWINLAAYITGKGNKRKIGIKAYLNGVQKLCNDVKLGGADPFAERDDIDETAGYDSGLDDEDSDTESELDDEDDLGGFEPEAKADKKKKPAKKKKRR